jgi:hypothetical protein
LVENRLDGQDSGRIDTHQSSPLTTFMATDTHTHQNTFAPDSTMSSLAEQAGHEGDQKAEDGWKQSSIEVELANVRESRIETRTYQVDVFRFLNGYPDQNEVILPYATRSGTPLRISVPIIPNKRYRLVTFAERIRNGDILQVRLLIRLRPREKKIRSLEFCSHESNGDPTQ